MSRSYAKENDSRAPDETTALLARQESTPERLESGRPAMRCRLEHSKVSLPAVDNYPQVNSTTGRVPLGASTGLGGANAPAGEPARQRRRLHKELVSNHERAANATRKPAPLQFAHLQEEDEPTLLIDPTLEEDRAVASTSTSTAMVLRSTEPQAIQRGHATVGSRAGTQDEAMSADIRMFMDHWPLLSPQIQDVVKTILLSSSSQLQKNQDPQEQIHQDLRVQPSSGTTGPSWDRPQCPGRATGTGGSSAPTRPGCSAARPMAGGGVGATPSSNASSNTGGTDTPAGPPANHDANGSNNQTPVNVNDNEPRFVERINPEPAAPMATGESWWTWVKFPHHIVIATSVLATFATIFTPREYLPSFVPILLVIIFMSVAMYLLNMKDNASLGDQVKVGFNTSAATALDDRKKLNQVGDKVDTIEMDVGIIKNRLNVEVEGLRQEVEAVRKCSDRIIKQNAQIIKKDQVMNAKLDALLERNAESQGLH